MSSYSPLWLCHKMCEELKIGINLTKLKNILIFIESLGWEWDATTEVFKIQKNTPVGKLVHCFDLRYNSIHISALDALIMAIKLDTAVAKELKYRDDITQEVGEINM